LYVDPSNTAAFELYKSLGYRPMAANDDTGSTDFVGPSDNRGRSMMYMFKSFTSNDKKAM
jgi:hypothetical protein